MIAGDVLSENNTKSISVDVCKILKDPNRFSLWVIEVIESYSLTPNKIE